MRKICKRKGIDILSVKMSNLIHFVSTYIINLVKNTINYRDIMT
jgi:hypothetical protein